MLLTSSCGHAREKWGFNRALGDRNRSAAGGGVRSFVPVLKPVLCIVLNKLEAGVRPAVSGDAGLLNILRAVTRLGMHGVTRLGMQKPVRLLEP